MLRKIRKILKTAKSLIFGNDQYSFTIHHEDWRAFNTTPEKPLGDPGFLISAKVHRCGKHVRVIFDSPAREVLFTYKEIKDGSILVNRALPIDRGTPFPVTVTIFR